jgi:hypothetical protein
LPPLNSEIAIADQVMYHDATHPSRVILPIIPHSAGDEDAPGRAD